MSGSVFASCTCAICFVDPDVEQAQLHWPGHGPLRRPCDTFPDPIEHGSSIEAVISINSYERVEAGNIGRLVCRAAERHSWVVVEMLRADNRTGHASSRQLEPRGTHV